MPRNGSGIYSLSDTVANATTADASELQAILNDIATALTGSMAADGQTPITGQMLGLVSTNPAWSFVADTNTGFGSDSADEAWIKAGGTEVVTVVASGATVTGTANVTGAATLSSTANVVGNFSVATNKFNVTAASGNTAVAGTLGVTGAATFSSTLAATIITGTGFVVGANPTATPGKTPTVQQFTSGTSQTYTTPAGVTWVRVRAIAGGGGGGGSAASSGGTGGTTSFNSITAVGGGGGGSHTTLVSGAGGTGGAGTATVRIPGGAGVGGIITAGSSMNVSVFGAGGSGFFGGAGAGGAGAGQANTGGGGGGFGTTGVGATCGGGGGAGEYYELIIGSPAATYTYSVGGSGTAGTSAGAGAAGRIIVEEFYN